jgi:hypothetical protein
MGLSEETEVLASLASGLFTRKKVLQNASFRRSGVAGAEAAVVAVDGALAAVGDRGALPAKVVVDVGRVDEGEPHAAQLLPPVQPVFQLLQWILVASTGCY